MTARRRPRTYIPCEGSIGPVTDRQLHPDGKVTANCAACGKQVRLRSMFNGDNYAPGHPDARVIDDGVRL